MRISGNKVKHLISFFHTELNKIYSFEEIDELVYRVFEHYLKFNKEDLTIRAEENLNQSDLIRIYDAAKDLALAKPLRYILGETYFYKYRFYVDQNVLIPRPETEELVDIIYKENKGISGGIIDLGTGSGCIPISLKCLLPNAFVEACDISEEALSIAERNAEWNKADVKLFKMDILHPNLSLLSKYDVMVSNPPYIKGTEAKQMHDNVLKYEPHLALFVKGDDAIVFYKKIIDMAKDHLNPKGKLYFELNPLTAHQVKDHAIQQGFFSSVEIFNDLSGNMRFFKATK